MVSRMGVRSLRGGKRIVPPRERLKQGPVAVIECFERIPCDPCQFLCSRGAIRPFANLNDLPELDWERCTGCGACISGCPGLAIFVVQERFSKEEALVRVPYECLPIPEKGSEVWALDRNGGRRHRAAVVDVQKNENLTHVVSIAVPKKLVMRVRNILPPEKPHGR